MNLGAVLNLLAKGARIQESRGHRTLMHRDGQAPLRYTQWGAWAIVDRIANGHGLIYTDAWHLVDEDFGFHELKFEVPPPTDRRVLEFGGRVKDIQLGIAKISVSKKAAIKHPETYLRVSEAIAKFELMVSSCIALRQAIYWQGHKLNEIGEQNGKQ